jgi:CRISPR-associated protein Csm5
MANYEITIEALSPIHVGGSQGRLTSLDFWQDENYVYLVSESRLAEILSRLGKIDDFVNFVKKGQRITLDDYLKQTNLKGKTSHKIVSRRIKKGEPEKCSNIMPFITDGASGEPYLPASSVKGALRGAMLYWVAKDSRELSEVKRKIKEMATRRGRKDKNSTTLCACNCRTTAIVKLLMAIGCALSG